MIRKPNNYLLFTALLFILTWLFVGIFRDSEFYNPQLFTKHKPSFKINFYSPTGESDLELHDLSSEDRLEELAYQEYVINQKLQNNNDSNLLLEFLPYLLTQGVVTLLLFGLLKQFRHIRYKIWYLPVHYTFCFTITALGIGFMLALDNIWHSFVFIFIICLINYIVFIFLTRKKQKPFSTKEHHTNVYKRNSFCIFTLNPKK